MKDIRPVLLTASDTGGAGTATRRIHNGLREIGVDSQMIVRDKSIDSSSIHGPNTLLSKAITKIRPHIDRLPLRIYDSPAEFSITWLPDYLQNCVTKFDPDVIHLNWIANGYMSPKTMTQFDCPIVWRLPDMWPFTGGCHYTDGCTKYQSTCGNCPQLNSNRSWDPTRLMLSRKKQAVDQADVTVVATSSWLASCAKKSSILENCNIEIIPNGLNTKRFSPRDPAVGRDLFNLPSDVPLILFGAVSPMSNPRKGFDIITETIQKASKITENEPELVVFGKQKPDDPPDLGLPVHYTGYLNDEESLALLYSAVDVMVVPSKYEGFGQTVIESMAAGTPVVAFDSTGPSDTISHKETGYLANPFDSSDLADGIRYLLEDHQRYARIAENGRDRTVQKYQYKDVAKQYYELYQQLIRG